jgi:ketosteroid isomerase-like protein
MKTEVTARSFESWLRSYQAAWEGRDPRAAGELFTADAEYYWTPFDPPQRGPAEIAAAWAGAVAHQKDVRFAFTVLALAGASGIAHWHASFHTLPSGERVDLDGIFVVEFADPSRCRVFREWWHRVAQPA